MSPTTIGITMILISISSIVVLPIWVRWWQSRGERAVAEREFAAMDYRASVRFWTECQRSGSPIEQALAPQMLAFLDQARPPVLRLGLNGETEPCRCRMCVIAAARPSLTERIAR